VKTLFAVLNKCTKAQAWSALFVKTMDGNVVSISQKLVTTKELFADQDTTLMTTWVNLAMDV
jgi:hypothetical protein